jgi:hypothetical protein
MEAVGTSETSVNFYQTTRLSNQEYGHIHEVIVVFLSISSLTPRMCLKIGYGLWDE